jgi:RNA polymerase sigma-70 factor, ECF subfamily
VIRPETPLDPQAQVTVPGGRRRPQVAVLADLAIDDGNRTGLLVRQGVHGSTWTASGMRQGAEERDDAALLRAVSRGDEAALATLYDRHAGWLTVRLARRCAMADIVDHAVQDTFLALWREAGAYRGRGDVAAFIWGIGIRRLIDLVRRENGAQRRLPWRAAEPAVVISAEDQVLAGVEHGRLGQALAQLSPELRGAIEATVLDGLTCAEAAVMLGVAEGTVKSRCHRARLALRAALADQQAAAETPAHRRRAWGTS